MKPIALLLCFAVLATACSRGTDNTSAQPSSTSSAILYPPGIVAPSDWATAVQQGVWGTNVPEQCCFLNGHPTLVLDNPPGSQIVVFTFYVPSVKPLLKRREQVTAAFNGILVGSSVLTSGMQNVSFTIPPSLRNRSHIAASLSMSYAWVPRKLGLNADRRELSVMLTRVGYI